MFVLINYIHKQIVITFYYIKEQCSSSWLNTKITRDAPNITVIIGL